MSINELKEAWQEYIQNGNLASEVIRSEILESWARCREKNVDPYQKTINKIADQLTLKKLLQKSNLLINISTPYIDSLYEFVKDSGFVVSLADVDGILLKIIGDESIKNRVKVGGFFEGADWSEISAGTNAVGTALFLKKPIQVFSYEHYCRCAQVSTCSGAPIRNIDSQIVGVIALSGYDKDVNTHTLGMAVAAANAIENALKMLKAQNTCDIANSYKSTIIDSISQGVLATDQLGRVTYLNFIASNLLGIRRKDDCEGKNIADILPDNNATLFSIIYNNRNFTDEEIVINTNRGTEKFNITSRSIKSEKGDLDGTVMIIDELKRARKMVHKMSGAVASINFQDLIGQNKKFINTINIAKNAAASDSTVLLLGESGTGKDVFAQAIHNQSNRRNGPFIPINCAAMPRELIGSELFGYVEGAFTGARKGGSLGKFELAEGGTIFLDEIGEMPLDLQTILLRVIEEKKITRIGGQEITPIDVRIIVATNRDLLEEVRKGGFRQDLYYRLNVISINMIPLRERRDDIPELINYFYQQQIKNLGKNFYPIPANFIEALCKYNFPGNIRELQNIIERSLNLSLDGHLDISLLPDEMFHNVNIFENRNDTLLSIDAFEKEKINELLKKHDGNISKISYELGIARSTLYRRLNKYGFKKYIVID